MLADWGIGNGTWYAVKYPRRGSCRPRDAIRAGRGCVYGRRSICNHRFSQSNSYEVHADAARAEWRAHRVRRRSNLKRVAARRQVRADYAGGAGWKVTGEQSNARPKKRRLAGAPPAPLGFGPFSGV